MDKENSTIFFNAKADSALLDILKKYNLEESDEESDKKFENDLDFNEVTLAYFAEDFALGKSSNAELLGDLEKKLKLNKEIIKSIALDIIDSVVPLLDWVEENELENHNQGETKEEPREQEFERAKAELMRKISKNKPAEEALSALPPNDKKESLPYKKIPDISNVEENAEQMEETRKPIISTNQPLKTVTPPSPAPRINDPYKESIE